jgi:DNA end-binding protein Ku
MATRKLTRKAPKRAPRKATGSRTSASRKPAAKSGAGKGGPERGIWSGAISFGLVNVPVRVVSAREQPDLRFTMLDPSNLSPVGYRYYNKATGEEVSRAKTVRAYEHEKGSYVVMTDADFKRANPKATQTIDIQSFVKLDEIDPVFFERAYYLLPNKGGQKGYQLLVAALRNTGKVAVAKIILHTKQHLAAIIARGDYLLLELLHFAADVRDIAELGDWREELEPSKNASREVEMAESLIESMTAAWDPQEFTDTYRDDIMKIVREKVKAGKATEITQDFDTRAEDTSAQVVDLMPLLRKSLETTRKTGNRKPARSAR